MFNFNLMNGFAPYPIVLTFVLFNAILCYFWFVYKPYAHFPSCRMEVRIPYWILKQVPLNYAAFQTLIEQARRFETEGIFTAWLGKPYLFVYGEDIVKRIVTEPAAVDKPKEYKLFEFAIGKGIFTSNGEMWKKQWKMVAPAFHVTALRSYTTVMNENAEEMIESLMGLNGQPTEDIVNILSLCGIRIVHETNTGEKENDIHEYMHAIMVLKKTTNFFVKRLCSPWLYFDFTLQLFPSARETYKLITSLLKENLKPRLEIIKESLIARQASLHASVPDPEWVGRRLKPFGESFVEEHLRDPTVTMDEVTRQTSLVFAAAFDTVVYAVMYALHLLGTHKELQERAFEEIMSETEGHLSYDDLRRLTYLECVIKESQRLYPVPIFGRYLRKDLQCGKFKIPKNSTIAVFTYMLHRNPEIYPDPEKFDPERFMDRNSKITPWNYIPFAEGLRSCIGKNYAMIEMKIILAYILRNFEVMSLNRLEEKDLCWSVILECKKNLKMQFLPRKQENQRKRRVKN